MSTLTLLCTGPESSGTRLLSRLASLYVTSQITVLHRSMPHGGPRGASPKPTYPDLTEFADYALISSRLSTPMLSSQIKAGHAPDRATAAAQTSSALLAIFEGLASTPYALVPYEAVVLHGGRAVRLALQEVGIPKAFLRDAPSKRPEVISNANLPHLP